MNDDSYDPNLDNLLNEMPPIPKNRPGLSQLSYRIGDYDTFFRRMLAYLPKALQQKVGETGTAPLSKLTTREPDDAAIALLDAWAIVADVLTFYQERIANEGYLLTATERLSVLELARSIGYELNPGVAASTSLAFTVEDASGSPDVVLIPKGTQVMSVPMKDELPQIFETDKDFIAHREWNALKPRLYRSQVFNGSTRQLFLNGTSTQLTQEDVLLVIDRDPNLRGYLLILTEVIEDRDANHTLVKWKETLPVIPPNTHLEKALQNPQVFAFRQRTRLFGYNAPQWKSLPAETKLEAIANSSDSAVAIQGGVFRSLTNGNDWYSVSKGLPNSDILCLATGDGVVFAGTSDKGIFRSLDNGDNWVAANKGLSSFDITALHISDKDSGFNSVIFVGTANGGLFRSRDQGQNWIAINAGSVRVKIKGTNNWQSINTGLPNTVIRSILTYTYPDKKPISGKGTIDIKSLKNKDTNINGIDTQFKTELKFGYLIIIGSEKRKIKKIISDTQIIIDHPFSFSENNDSKNFLYLISEPKDYIFVGTDQGVYCSIDYGQNWYPKNLIQRIVYALCFIQKNIDNSSESNYIFAGTDKGIFVSSDNGNRWKHLPESQEDRILSLLIDGISIPQAQYLFAGTDKGVIRFLTNTDNTASINLHRINQINELPSTIVHSLTIKNDEASNRKFLIIATNKGIFRASDYIQELATWEFINKGLNTQDFRAITSTSTQLFVGAKFTGFSSLKDWPDLKIQEPLQLDLETLYPQILPDSWVILIDNRQTTELLRVSRVLQFCTLAFLRGTKTLGLSLLWVIFMQKRESAHQIQRVVSVDRSEFGLSGKITRLELNPQLPSKPENFDIRSTIVFSGSEMLSLAPEPLTISDRQQDIFADPIDRNRIYLNEFIPNLQADQKLIIRGQRMQVNLIDIGGIFEWERSEIGNKKSDRVWKPINQGLRNSQVLNLAQERNQNKTVLMAGTTQGIFRSNDRGVSWEPLPEGLINPETSAILAVKSLLFAPFKKPQQSLDDEKQWLAATAVGVFRLAEDKRTWKSFNEQLVYRDIQMIANIGSDSEPLIVIGTLKGGISRLNNDTEKWESTTLNNIDVSAIASDDGAVFVGTVDDGIFRSDGTFLSDNASQIQWTKIKDTTVVSGYLHSKNTSVVWDKQGAKESLKIGDAIHANGQKRTILSVSIDEDKIIVDESFRPDLPFETEFEVETGLTNCNITALAIAKKPKILFAGTNGSGVFRSTAHEQTLGDRWEQIITGLDNNLEIRCLAIEEKTDSKFTLWAGTAQGGVFRSHDNGDHWEPVNTNLTNIDVRTILISQFASKILIGGIGFLVSDDGLRIKHVQRYDELELRQPPINQSSNIKNPSQRLFLEDKDGFNGTLDLPDPKGLKLLPANPNSEFISEIVEIQRPPTNQQLPILGLKESIKNSYDPSTVSILANVVEATHGETVEEVLGSGEGHLKHQAFTLKKPPLTFVPADNATGAESSLKVRVNGKIWQGAKSLYELKRESQAYILQINENVTTTQTCILFGDGIRGARLPTGEENIIAIYRSGLGLSGNVTAGSLSILKTRPQGISDVINPLAATGASEPERLADARKTAPSNVRTLDRIVSLSDFEDFALSFTGIFKAKSVSLWNGETQLVHITIAGENGAEIPEESNLYRKLIDTMNNARDPFQQMEVASYIPLRFNLEAKVKIDEQQNLKKTIQAKIEKALQENFAFDHRSFGQSVTSAEVTTVIGSIDGVVAVNLVLLYQSDLSRTLERTLESSLAYFDPRTDKIKPANLLLINPTGLELKLGETL